MILLSDFEDYYDQALEGRDANGTFIRRRAHISRREGFEYLHRLGWPTVPYGTLQELYERFGKQIFVVAYLNEYLHGLDAGGQDPLLVMEAASAAKEMPQVFGSFYVPFLDAERKVFSFTHLTIGRRCFLLEYHQLDSIGSSPTSWASNRGRFEARVVHEVAPIGLEQGHSAPIWSVDYVMAAHQEGSVLVPTAFDFNPCAVLRGTGIEQMLGPEAVVDLIMEAIDHYRIRRHADNSVEPKDAGRIDTEIVSGALDSYEAPVSEESASIGDSPAEDAELSTTSASDSETITE